MPQCPDRWIVEFVTSALRPLRSTTSSPFHWNVALNPPPHSTIAWSNLLCATADCPNTMPFQESGYLTASCDVNRIGEPAVPAATSPPGPSRPTSSPPNRANRSSTPGASVRTSAFDPNTRSVTSRRYGTPRFSHVWLSWITLSPALPPPIG